MSEYLHKLGVGSEWQFHEIMGIDDSLLSMVPQPVLAVLLLFPISNASEQAKSDQQKAIEANPSHHQSAKSLFHMKQTVGNACGTIGLIHAVLNNTDRIDLAKDGW